MAHLRSITADSTKMSASKEQKEGIQKVERTSARIYGAVQNLPVVLLLAHRRPSKPLSCSATVTEGFPQPSTGILHPDWSAFALYTNPVQLQG